MAGCFGDHPVDRYLESQLNEYLDAQDRADARFEYLAMSLEEQYGDVLDEIIGVLNRIEADEGFNKKELWSSLTEGRI